MAEETLQQLPDPKITVEPIGDKEQEEANNKEVELQLYQSLDEAINTGDEVAQLNAYKNLQSFYISQETLLDKTAVAGEAGLKGINKGLTIGLGLPVDISNFIIGLGEKGINKILEKSGSEKNVKVKSDKPFLGGKQLGDFFDKIGIETNYDKNRTLSAVTGRIAEEVGVTIPLMGITLAGATPKNMLKLGGVEMGLATTGGTGAAIGEGIDNRFFYDYDGPVNFELWGQALGYVSPITVGAAFKAINQGIGLSKGVGSMLDKFDSDLVKFFKPQNTSTKLAANILFSKLDESEITSLLTELQNKNLSKEVTKDELFGDPINQTNFPRMLDEFFDNEQLSRLRLFLESKEGSTDLVNSMDAYFQTRNIHLENIFRKKIQSLPEGATADDIITFLNKFSEDQIGYVQSKFIMAEQKAAEKMALFGDDIKIEDATSILKMELENSLDDLLIQEKNLWSKVKSKVNTGDIGDAAADIIANQYKTADKSSIPEIFFNLSGNTRLKDIGYLGDNAKEGLGLLDKGAKGAKFSADEVLNLRARIYDEIKATDGTTVAGRAKIDNYNSLLRSIDDSLLTGVTTKNMDNAQMALGFSNYLKTNVYDSEVGKVLGHNTNTGKINVIDANKFSQLLKKGEQGGVQSKDFLKIIGKESEGARTALYSDINKMKDASGNINRNTLTKYLNNNRQLINELGLQDEFKDLDIVLANLSEAGEALNLTKIEVGKHRKDILLTNVDNINITNPQIVSNIFKEAKKNQDLTINSVIKIKDLLKNDDLAFAAFQDDVTNYLLNSIKVIDQKGEKVLNLKQTINFIDDNEKLLKSIYGENYTTVEYFKNYLKEIQIKNPKSGPLNVEALERNNIVISALGRILGAKAGSMGVGPPLVLAGLGGRVANKIFSGKTNSEVFEILAKAFRDKDFAAELIKPLSDDIAEQIEGNINRLLQDNKAVFSTSGKIAETTIENFERNEKPDVQSVAPEEPQASLNLPTVNPASRLANTNLAVANTNLAAANPNTMDRGQELFGGPREITFASQGGIMNSRRIMQRVI